MSLFDVCYLSKEMRKDLQHWSHSRNQNWAVVNPVFDFFFFFPFQSPCTTNLPCSYDGIENVFSESKL